MTLSKQSQETANNYIDRNTNNTIKKKQYIFQSISDLKQDIINNFNNKSQVISQKEETSPNQKQSNISASISLTIRKAKQQQLFKLREIDRQLRDAYHFYYKLRYDRRYQKQANAAYSAIVAQDSGATLTPKIQRKIEAYAREVLGCARYIPWLKVYAAYRGEFKEGWLPDNYYGQVVLPIIQGDLRGLSRAKTISRRLLETDLLPDIAYQINGVWIDTHGNTIKPQDLKSLVFKNDTRVFVKLDGSNQGRGVFPVDRASFEIEELAALGNFVVQSSIQQSAFFDRFSTSSVATLRITTVKAKGAPAKMYAAYLRLGRENQTAVTSASHIRVPVIDNKGTLGDLAALPNWQKITSHPDTGATFENLVIPSFDAAVKACTSLHDRMPHVTIIGWDTAIDKSEQVQIIEWNSNHPDIKFSEASTGPCFSKFSWDSLWQRP
ncbi:MAG: sugar-transfer associated ATP-grasp domain-containing protein [Prochloraceae cyanobacterium]